MEKRISAFFLAVCLTLGMLPGTARAESGGTFPFRDVAEDAAYYDAVRYVYENHLMNGTTDTLFEPDGTMDRAQLATVLYRLEGSPAVSGASFRDVEPGQWYTDGIAWASAEKLVTGYSDGRFGPADPVTREDMATIFHRYAKYKGNAAAGADLGKFEDASAIRDYAVDAMKWAVSGGVIGGVTATKLEPRSNATRAQIAVALQALSGGGKKRFEKIPQIKAKDTYVTIEAASSGYDSAVITDELIAGCTLPEATVSDLPYWTGFVLENKLFANAGQDDRWSVVPDGVSYWYEGEIALIAQEGFNCARCVYSLTYLGSPDDPEQISENALAELDALISWGLKYNVHIMLSITGAPDCWGDIEKESVNTIFNDPHCGDLFHQYMTMLAKRYVGVPAKALSFELVAEAAVAGQSQEESMAIYNNRLLPTVKEIHAADPDRILIANDLHGSVSEELAKAGCVLSLHAHARWMRPDGLSQYGFGPATDPVPFLPMLWNKSNGALTLKKPDGFFDCTLKIYCNYNTGGLHIAAEGKVLHDSDAATNVMKPGCTEVKIPDGVKSVTISANGYEYAFECLVLEQGEKKIPFPATVRCTENGRVDLPTITLDPEYQPVDGIFDSDDFYEWNVVYNNKSIADKHNVGFILTEICCDQPDLSLEEYLAAEELETGFVKKQQIPWMWNCIENVIAPKARIWPNSFEHRLRETEYEGIYIDDAVMDYIKSLT